MSWFRRVREETWRLQVGFPRPRSNHQSLAEGRRRVMSMSVQYCVISLEKRAHPEAIDPRSSVTLFCLTLAGSAPQANTRVAAEACISRQSSELPSPELLLVRATWCSPEVHTIINVGRTTYSSPWLEHGLHGNFCLTSSRWLS